MPSHYSAPCAGCAPSGIAAARPLFTWQEGHAMEPVVTLGLSVLPNRTELVVLRGRDGRGGVLDRVVTATNDGASAIRSRLRQTVEAVLQTQALAVAHGYHVHAVGVMSDGANAPLTRWLIVALESAGLENVTALDPAVAGEIFTRSASVENHTTDHPRSRLRQRLIFLASVAIALAALAFAIGDRLAVHHRPRPTQPAPTPTISNTAVETPPPSVPAPPPPLPSPPAEPPAPAYTPPPRRTPVQQQPPQPPPPPSPSPPPEPPEPAAPDDCMFLCGVTI